MKPDPYTLLHLDRYGRLTIPGEKDFIPAVEVDGVLSSVLAVEKDVTDIFVWVHGWQTPPAVARNSVEQLIAGIEESMAARSNSYPLLDGFKGAYIAVAWPSTSSRFGYFKIRNRAHRMSQEGDAARVLAAILGYLDRWRRRPQRGLLQTSTGQYLHCVGHSFGGRFLAQAITLAAEDRLRTLPLLPRNQHFPFTVDNLLVFQMAARPDIFDGRLRDLIDHAPLQGPVCLTFSHTDRATCFWHRIAEHAPGIGCCGASAPADRIRTIRLHPVGSPYEPTDLAAQVVNIDATWRFHGGHSDIWHQESFHLLLSLAQFARYP